MSQMKRYFEERLDELTNEELLEMGYSEQDIEELREIYDEDEE